MTIWGWIGDPFAGVGEARYVARVLHSLGYRTKLHLGTHADLTDDLPLSVFGRIQVVHTGWTGISAWDFFATWLSCNGNGDHGWFCSARLDRDMRRARSLESDHPRAGSLLWGRVDHEIVRQAALVPLVNPQVIVFTSRRVRNFQQHAYLNLIADQVWLT